LFERVYAVDNSIIQVHETETQIRIKIENSVASGQSLSDPNQDMMMSVSSVSNCIFAQTSLLPPSAAACSHVGVARASHEKVKKKLSF
jgi:hypothetical protein